MAKSHDPQRSSIAVGGQKKKRGLLPLILGLLLLLILIALVVGLVSCGDDDDKTASTPTTSAAPATPSTSAPEASATAPATAATLTAGADDVLADTAKITDHVGDSATGTELEVLSVVESGFFVGTDDSDRQYVEYGGAVGEDEAAVELPAVGNKVGLEGEVRPAPEDPAQTLKLESADAELVSERGAYVNATSVTPSAG